MKWGIVAIFITVSQKFHNTVYLKSVLKKMRCRHTTGLIEEGRANFNWCMADIDKLNTLS